VKLADFNAKLGLIVEQSLKSRDDSSCCGCCINKSTIQASYGSPPYMSPELFNNEKKCLLPCSMTQSELLEAIDIWAIGVTLFVMITGAFPWQRAELSDPHYAKYVEQRLGTISASKCTSVWSCFNLSPDVTDLLVHMLEPNLSLRWSLARVSTHPW